MKKEFYKSLKQRAPRKRKKLFKQLLEDGLFMEKFKHRIAWSNITDL